MILLGMPFVFGSQRSISIGKLITFGVLAGVAFYVVTQVTTHIGSSMQWPPLIIVLLPIMVALIILLFARWWVLCKQAL